jgi:restriction endonuclease Mrr
MVPPFKFYFYPFLQCLLDCEPHTVKEIAVFCAEFLGLLPQDLEEVTKSGKNKHKDHVNWVVTYLKKMELIKKTEKRGEYVITEPGKKLIIENGAKTNLNTIRNLPLYKRIQRRDGDEKSYWVESHFKKDGSNVPGYRASITKK